MSDIEAGNYRAHALAATAQFGLAKNGSDQFAVDIYLDDIGETVTCVLSFSGKAKPYSADKMKAMGFTVSDSGELECSGVEFTAVVSYEEFEGAERMRVDVMTSRVKLSPMGAPQKRAFLSELRGLLR